MPWQPLLDGAWNVSAWESVRAILADLESQGREPSGDPSLAGGTTGLAILQGYLAQAGGGSASVAVARRCLEYATASMAEQPGTGSEARDTSTVTAAIPLTTPRSQRPRPHLPPSTPTIHNDHQVPQPAGSAPPNASRALAMPQLPWHRTCEPGA